MPNLTVLLASYGHYHRDPRNRLTHYFGVPAIAYAVLVPAALCAFTIFGLTVTFDRLIVAAFVLFYLSLDLRLAITLAIVLTLLAWVAETTTRLGVSGCLALAGVVFVLGWVLQLLGHHLEGNRPALLTNLFQIVVAPIFLAAEGSFALGLRKALKAEVEKRLDLPVHPSRS
ncbi:MAG: Mpo1-like protein [Steroidobacteraceae bacterium]